MSDVEVKELRELVNCMERKVLQAIADLRVHIAEGYVSKEDFTLYKQEQSTGKRSGISNTIMGAGILVSLVLGIIGLFIK